MQISGFGARRRKPANGRFSFGTKAETLARVAPALRGARVLPLLYFTQAEWRSGKAPILRRWDPLESTCRHASLSIL